MISKLSRSLLVLALAITGLILWPGNASATITPKKVVVFQGDLNAWVTGVGADAVAANLAQADILVMTYAASHVYGGSDWPNLPYGSQGCNSDNNRASLISVLSRVKALKPSALVFGYVAGPADAPDQLVGGVNRPALCGNNVNNYLPGTGTPPASSFGNCPNGSCLNFVHWVNDWTNTSDSLHTYINGIFIDYVSSEKLSTVTRDNLYNYVHAVGLRVMANSTLPGAPCVGCTSTNGDSGSVDNYQFAADSSQLLSTDYMMVEGYYWAGFNGNGGVSTDESVPTGRIASIRSTLATKYGGVEPRIAALITEPTDATFTSLSCSWSDYTSARSTFMASAVDGDAISYQFSDYGTLPPKADGSPSRPIPYCG